MWYEVASTEGIFFLVKRIFGECVKATKKRNMYKEAKRKFWAYNRLLQVRYKEKIKIAKAIGKIRNHATRHKFTKFYI